MSWEEVRRPTATKTKHKQKNKFKSCKQKIIVHFLSVCLFCHCWCCCWDKNVPFTGNHNYIRRIISIMKIRTILSSTTKITNSKNRSCPKIRLLVLFFFVFLYLINPATEAEFLNEGVLPRVSQQLHVLIIYDQFDIVVGSWRGRADWRGISYLRLHPTQEGRLWFCDR